MISHTFPINHQPVVFGVPSTSSLDAVKKSVMTNVDLLFDRAPTEVFLTWQNLNLTSPSHIVFEPNRWELNSSKVYQLDQRIHKKCLQDYRADFPQRGHSLDSPFRLCTAPRSPETPKHGRRSEGAGHGGQSHDTWTAAPARSRSFVGRSFQKGPKRDPKGTCNGHGFLRITNLSVYHKSVYITMICSNT